MKTRVLSTQAELINATESLSDQDVTDEDSNKITLRIFTRMGVQRLEAKRNEGFLVVYEKLAELEKTGIENLILMHGEKRVQYGDTPESLNVLFTDFIECHYVKGKVEERIEIIESGVDIEGNNKNMVEVILQTSLGRKSRVRFNIARVG